MKTMSGNSVRVPYSFSILRYVHDSVTQEFLNIGVAVYSPQGFFLQARCTPHYGRLNHTFGGGSGTGGAAASKIDGERFRQLTRYIEQEVNAIGGLSVKMRGGEAAIDAGVILKAL